MDLQKVNNYRVCRVFKSLQCFQVQADVYCHSNFIRIKLSKTNSYKSILFSFHILILALICLISCYLHPMNIRLKILFSCALILMFILFALHVNVIEESLEIIRSIHGVNYYSKNMLGKETSKFINSTNFVINESITMFRVISFLAVLTCDSSQLTSSRQVNLIFTKLLPRNDCLEFVYTHIRNFLDKN